jgi:hypothetical protein
MAIRNDDDDYDWVLQRNLRPIPAPRADDEGSTQPVLADTLIKVATAVAGFAGVMLLVGAVVTAFR